jgi:hypothetical protein
MQILTLSAFAGLAMCLFIAGTVLGVAFALEVAYHFVKTDGSFKFRWRGKSMCIKGNRKQ